MAIDVKGPVAATAVQNETADGGNLRGKIGIYDLAGLAQNKVAAICKVPPYASLFALHWGHDALGANTTLAFGTESQDGTILAPIALKADAATTAAGAGYAVFQPIDTGPSGMYITVTQGGAGAATGSVWVVPVLVYNGY